jgi:hypothetical protein
MVERFLAARPTETVVAFGVYRGGSGTLILTSVGVTEQPRATPPN